MTLVSEIITDAYRQSNLLPINTSPTTAQQTEALRYLNRIVSSVFGNEAGENFTSFPIGRHNINRPQGYPWYNNEPDGDWFVPKNTRVVLNLESALNLYLHPDPDDGSRFALMDMSNNLSTYNVRVYGNGRLIEGATYIDITVNGTDSEWFYRADTGNWQKYSPLLTSDTFPFPIAFDDFFITMLAMRLNPSYGTALSDESKEVLGRARSQLRSRYDQHIPMPSEYGLLRMSRMAQDRDEWGSAYMFYDANDMFTKGWPW